MTPSQGCEDVSAGNAVRMSPKAGGSQTLRGRVGVGYFIERAVEERGPKNPLSRDHPLPISGRLPRSPTHKAGARLLLPTCEEADEGGHEIVFPGPRKEPRCKGHHDDSGEERKDDGGQQENTAHDDVNCRGGRESWLALGTLAQRAEPCRAWAGVAPEPGRHQVPKRGLGPRLRPDCFAPKHALGSPSCSP